MKRLLLIIPLILAVLVFGDFRTSGYRSGASYSGDFEFGGDVYIKDGNLIVGDGQKIIATDDTEADTLQLYGDGTYTILVGDNDLYVDCGATAKFIDGIQAFTDTTKSSGTAGIRWKEIWGLRLMTSSPDDADSVTISDDGTNTIISADNPLAINTSVNYAADAQNDDDYEVAIPGITALVAGLTVTFLAQTANTDGATLEITSVGDVDSIFKLHDTTLATNDIKAGAIVVVVFDGSDWQMVSQLSQ